MTLLMNNNRRNMFYGFHNFFKAKFSSLSLIKISSTGNKLSLKSKIYHKNTQTQTSSNMKCLTLETMHPGIKRMEFPFYGPLKVRASEIRKELDEGIEKPFKEIISSYQGDNHASGQIPITFTRQVMALVSFPKLLNDHEYPEDVKKRSRDILTGCRGGSVGSYSNSVGIEIIRKHVAQYIERRDGGITSNWNDVALHNGASKGIRVVLKMLIGRVDGRNAGVMIPNPQYPLFSASLTEFGMDQINYYLNEETGWSIEAEELERAYNEAKKRCNPRAIVIINPGNPTGHVLSRENIENIIKFAYKYSLLIFADEVYQDNIYDANYKFFSFKKVMKEMGSPYSEMELASFMSSSKGYIGECGVRGGYSEVINLDPRVRIEFLKSLSVSLCPTILGQAVVDCVANPPQPGEPSFEKFINEKEAVLRSLAERAIIVTDTLNNIPGITCNPVQGAMYAFPRVQLPAKAVAKAKSLGLHPSTFYVFHVLENTGIFVLPGEMFGQRPENYHFRATILLPPEKLQHMLTKLKYFHTKFLKEFGD